VEAHEAAADDARSLQVVVHRERSLKELAQAFVGADLGLGRERADEGPVGFGEIGERGGRFTGQGLTSSGLCERREDI
jgi:hypothetical protein